MVFQEVGLFDKVWLHPKQAKVANIQNADEASLQHALDMGCGKRIKKIFYRTLQEAFTYDALDYIGCTTSDDPNVQDLLEFHSHLLLRHIGCIHEADAYHRSYRWKMIQCLNKSMVPSILNEMKSLWTFVTSCIDTCSSKTGIWKELAWTRSQPFRECFVVAELLAFGFRAKVFLPPCLWF